MARRRTNTTWRVWTVVAAISLGALIITIRLAQLQIVNHEQYAEEARLTHLAQETVSDRRGALLDRNGYPLAASSDSFNVMVEKDDWDDPAKAADAAQELSEVTGVPAREMLDIVRETDVFEVPVARGLNFETATAVRGLHLRGVRLLESSRRVYPEGNLAAQLLGFVGTDNSGLTGLEADLEGFIGGATGTVTYERDGLGNQIAFGDRTEIPPRAGANVVLTIDRYIQRLAEQELNRAIKEHKASGGSIIAVDPETGEILAMASRPTFDVTRLDLGANSKLDLFRNRAITDAFEPGSIFKLITMACALDTGVVTPGTWWYDDGTWDADGWSIRNWDNSAHGDQTVTQILSRSLNTGAAWLASQAGPDAFYSYVQSFGFGTPTGSGLSGEAAGRVRTPENDPDYWRTVDMATNSFGQGISVTPLQMVMAVAAIANDGLAMKPQIVKEVLSPGQSQVVEPEPGLQVITQDTARTLREMMGVVVDGISTNYLDVQGYRVGGKTGTANIALENGGYKPDAYISSFIGVAPLEDPQIVILVKIDEPKDVPWGSVVSAPAFGRIAQAALAYMKVPPSEAALVSAPE